MKVRRTLLAALAGAVATAACGTGSGVSTERADPPETTAAPATDPPGTTADTTEPPDATDPPETSEPEAASTLEWREFDEGLETAILEVPVDYDDPDGPTFELFLARRLADDQDNKIGSLLINPGGPGLGGAEYAAGAEFVLDDELLERFDIVGWDPRGTGYSEPAIDCVDDYDEYYAGWDITPDDEAERQQIIDVKQDFTERCVENNEDILEHVGTNDTARDMDSIRRALGEETISYFGFSYGSELGATWATLFPDTVRAAVLDGASDPNADALEGSLQQSAGFEATLTTYLAQCSADPECAFHNGGDAEGAFDTLMAQLDETPIPSESGRPDITRDVALQAVAEAMYSDDFWEQLSEALAAAQGGDGSGLLALWDSYYRRLPDGTWPNFLEAFQVIRCMDDVQRLTVEEDDATAPQFNAVAPRFRPGTTGDYFCTFFPPTRSPRAEITGADAGPIVVIGTTGDAATPLQSTRNMAAALEDGRLVVVDADRHGGYQVNDCVQDVVHRYLVDLEVPAGETSC
jgi:pimeloyl-ACP methyl ester carboxylesterase